MSNNLDQLFKQALRNKIEEPPAYIWENIDRYLSRQEKRKVIFWWWRGLAAGIALLAAVAGIWLLQQREKEVISAGLVRTYPLANIPLTCKPGFPDSLHALLAVADRHENTLLLVPNYPAEEADWTSDNRRVILPEKKEIRGIWNTLPEPSITTRNLRRISIPLTSKEAYRNQKEYMLLLHADPKEEKEKKHLTFSLSGHIVPGYSAGSYSSSLKNTRGNTYSDEQLEGMMNVGGGIKVSVSAGKRLSLHTGLFYSRMGQKTTESANGLRTMSLSALSQQTINTPLGNIKTSTKSVAYRSAGASLLNSMGNRNESIEQTFGALEIPLGARFRLNENKIQFSVSAGFCGNFIVSNKVFLKAGDNKEYLGSTEGIRDFNISTDWALGVEYPLSKKIRIMLEPGFKYYLQSLSENEHIDYKPYMFSLSTGIGIEF